MTREIKIIELDGNPFERGLKYGKYIKKNLTELLEDWKYFLRIKLNVMDFEKWIKNFMTKTHFVEAVKKYTPDLLEEVKGLASGAEIDFDTIFTYQCQDEIFWIDQNYAFNPTEYNSSAAHCTSLGIWKNGKIPTICGQNVDWYNIFDPYHCVLHIKDPETQIEQYVNSFFGFLGSTGMNNIPISVNCNSLFFFLNNSLYGLPVVFVLRGILGKKSFSQATEFIQTINHASGQNYTIGGDEKALNFECSANKKAIYFPHKDLNRVYHTNHPFVNTDVILPIWKLDLLNSSTFPRYDYVDFRLKDPNTQVDLETVKGILRSHIGSVCVHHENKAAQGGSSASLIYVLSKENPQFLVTNGPPCLSDYTVMHFNQKIK